MFKTNQKVIINENAITANQNYSTPGIYKVFDIKLNTTYKINFVNFDKNNSGELLLWIATLASKTIRMIDIDNNTIPFIYENRKYPKIKIGILFKSPNIGDTFILDNIIVEKYTTNDKISVVIPCLYIHLEYIENLLETYQKKQTLLPNEIIIVIAEANKLDSANIKKIRYISKIGYPFSIKIIKIDTKSLAGNSRYIGAKNASHEIIVFQDADDIPHNQRLEIIKYFFDKHPSIVHMCHKWSKNKLTFGKKFRRFNKIDYIIPKFDMFSDKQYRKLQHVANGNIAIRKNIVDKLEWFKDQYRRQDIALNIDIYTKFAKTLFIKEELYLYRCEFSTYKHNLQYKKIIN
jgi:cellulose synthase/poly-beta-1,6-N-acetylglucosamine synthase-like glycosyltransferase